MKHKPERFIGVFLLAMMNLAVMTSLRNLPLVAEFGFAAAFLFLFVALVFFVPVAFISAELATGWPREGGIYVWVREALGPFWGFFAVWMQWVHNVPWYPVILSFSSVTLASLVYPAIATNEVYLFISILLCFWGFTLFNYFPLKTSSLFSAAAVIAGTILPGLFLIGLGVAWISRGDPLEISFSWQALIPELGSLQNLVFLSGLFLAFGGMEVSAGYARDVQHPQKSFPRAILLAGLLSFVLYILGALSIAIMIPSKKISLIQGVIEAFELFLSHFHLGWIFIPLGLMILFGVFGELNAWIIGPVQALHATAKHGDLPPFFQKLNRHDRPFNLLIFQGVIVSIAALAFLLLPSASTAFWILSALSAQLYLVMYILLFISGIRLRYTHPEVKRQYRVPFGCVGIWILGLLGISSSLFGFFLAFVPPGQLEVGNLFVYEGFLLFGIFVMFFIPYLIFRFRHPRWHPEIGD